MPNTDTLAANHGQNRSRGFAVRCDSGMISMPACSIRVETGVLSVLTTASMLCRCDKAILALARLARARRARAEPPP